MSFRSFAHSEVGITHTKKSPPLPCQDNSGCYDDENLNLVVVADGHGDSSCFRSDLGSKFAVDSAIEGIKAFVEFKNIKELFMNGELPSKNVFDKLIREKLLNNIVGSWITKVHEHFSENPFSDDDIQKCDSEKYRNRYTDAVALFKEKKELSQYVTKAYGSSLIGAAITPDYWFGFHIGDGRWTCLYKGGRGDQHVPWDKRCFLNVTTSICDDDILTRSEEDKEGAGVRLYSSFRRDENGNAVEAPVGFFICSDGIDDNYSADEKENREELCRLYRNISLAYVDAGYDDACEQVKKLINVRWANAGKGDDTSIGIIINTDELQDVKEEWRAKIKEGEEKRQKAKEEKAEKARLEREQAERESQAEETAMNFANEAKTAAKEAENSVSELKNIEKELSAGRDELKKLLAAKNVESGGVVGNNNKLKFRAAGNAQTKIIAANDKAGKTAEDIKKLSKTVNTSVIKKALIIASDSERYSAASVNEAKTLFKNIEKIYNECVSELISFREKQKLEQAKAAQTQPPSGSGPPSHSGPVKPSHSGPPQPVTPSEGYSQEDLIKKAQEEANKTRKVLETVAKAKTNADTAGVEQDKAILSAKNAAEALDTFKAEWAEKGDQAYNSALGKINTALTASVNARDAAVHASNLAENAADEAKKIADTALNSDLKKDVDEANAHAQRAIRVSDSAKIKYNETKKILEDIKKTYKEKTTNVQDANNPVVSDNSAVDDLMNNKTGFIGEDDIK